MINRLLLIMGCFIFNAGFAQLSVQQPLVENQSNPLGIDLLNPRFSWQLSSDKRNILQTAYEIKVVVLPGTKKLLWNSGKVLSGQSVQVSYTGPALKSGQKYSWQVRIWTNDGTTSSWSQPAFWQMGLLSPSDWKAKWIQPGYIED